MSGWQQQNHKGTIMYYNFVSPHFFILHICLYLCVSYHVFFFYRICIFVLLYMWSCHVESYHIISHHITSQCLCIYHITSYHIISYRIISCCLCINYIISYHITSYHIILFVYKLYHITSHHITSYHIVSYHIVCV